MPMPKPDFVALVDQVLRGSADEQEIALATLEEPRNRKPLKRAPAEHPELLNRVGKLYESATPRVRALALAISDSAQLASRAIRDEDARIRERATDVLVEAGDVALLTDERPSVRVRILRRLRFGAGTPFLDQIVELLDDPDPTVAGHAAKIVVVERPTEPRLVGALVRYLPVATDSCELANALATTIASQPEANAAVDALCSLLRQEDPRGSVQWTNDHIPYRMMVVLSVSRAAASVDVARALFALAFEEDPRIATSAVDALALGSPAISSEVTAALATAASTPLRARLVAVLSFIGETSHVDAIRRLVASDDAAPWGGWQAFRTPTALSNPANDVALERFVLRDIGSSAAETPARWVGGLLAIRALRSRKSELLPELHRIVEQCEDPVVVCTAADDLVALAGGEEERKHVERSLRSAQQRLGESAGSAGDSIALALSRLAQASTTAPK